MEHLFKHKPQVASPRRSTSSPPPLDPLLGSPSQLRRPSLGASVRSVFRPGPGSIRTRRRLLILAFLVSLVALLYLNGVRVFAPSSDKGNAVADRQARDAAAGLAASHGGQAVLPGAHSQQELQAMLQLASADPKALESCLAGWNATSSSQDAVNGAKHENESPPSQAPNDKKGAVKSSASTPSPSQRFGTPLFSYLARERGSFERITDHIAPRTQPLKRRRGLLAVPVSGKSKAQIAPVLARFRQDRFDIMLFHYDAADWSDVPHYNEFTSIRVFGQTKFWFAKRFLVPELVENYDYIFLWDDDVGLDAMWSPTQFVAILQQYGIHAAQPALSEGARPGYPQYETVRFHPETIWKKSVGRFADFVEVMFPVFSREAWQNCIWETIPYDGRSFWGVDNAWYPHCSSLGYCRFAIIDALPVAHLDQRSLYQPHQNNLREFGHYTSMYKRLCSNRPSDLDSAATLRIIMICNFIRRRPLGWSFNSLAVMDPVKDGGSKGKKRCPEPSLWPGIENKPWFGNAVDEPVLYEDGWVDKVLGRAAQVHIGHNHLEKQPEVVEEKKPSPEQTSSKQKSRGKLRASKVKQQKKTRPVVQQEQADAAA